MINGSHVIVKIKWLSYQLFIINMCMFVDVYYLVLFSVLALVLPTNGTLFRETFSVLCTFQYQTLASKD